MLCLKQSWEQPGTISPALTIFVSISVPSSAPCATQGAGTGTTMVLLQCQGGFRMVQSRRWDKPRQEPGQGQTRVCVLLATSGISIRAWCSVSSSDRNTPGASLPRSAQQEFQHLQIASLLTKPLFFLLLPMPDHLPAEPQPCHLPSHPIETVHHGQGASDFGLQPQRCCPPPTGACSGAELCVLQPAARC